MERSDIRRRARTQDGITRMAAVLLAGIVVLLVAIGIPVYRTYAERAAVYGCGVAVDKAQDMLDIQYIQARSLTLEEAQQIVDRSRISRDDLCPEGGEYLVLYDEGREQPFRVVCGLHDSDTAERTRLCAYRALERVRRAVRDAQALGDRWPESVTISLNGKEQTASLTLEKVGITRGTYTTQGYDGTVIFYGLAGYGGFAESGMDEGEVCWSCYADEDHCAIWEPADAWSSDWSGDSWEGVSELGIAEEGSYAVDD